MQRVRNAAFNLVHEWGTDRVAQLLDKNVGTVCHEVKPPANGSAKFGLIDAVKVSVASGDHRILNAFAEVCGCVVVALPQAVSEDAATTDVLQRTSQLAREFGESMALVAQAMADGRVTQNELMEFDRESMELIGAITNLRTVMHAKAEQDRNSPAGPV